MSVLFSSRKDCYCAFCRSPRKVYLKKNIGLMDILGAALGSAVAMLAIFQEFDPRALLIFVAFLAVAETFVQIRWRLMMVCRHCGFDPVLYLKDSSVAAAKVKMRLERRKEDPATLLSRPLRLPQISKEKAQLIEKAQKAGPSLVSKRV
jgi:hypothetical protein